MATTPKLGITLLESGAVQKEAVINTAFETIDSKVIGLSERTETVGGSPAVIAECKLEPTTANTNSEVVMQIFSGPAGQARREVRIGADNIGVLRGFSIQSRSLNADGTLAAVQDGGFTIGGPISTGVQGAGTGGSISWIPNVNPLSGQFTISSAGSISIAAPNGLRVFNLANNSFTQGNAGQVLSSRGLGQHPLWTNPSGYQGQLAGNPATTGLSPGSTYFNTSNNKLHILGTDSVWRAVA